MKALRIFTALVLLTGGLLGLSACNSIGPYYGRVYRLDEASYLVVINTWIGSGRETEDLKRRAEQETFAELRNHGIEVESCEFHEFTPFEGGHMAVDIVAGTKVAVARWTKLSKEEFNQALRERPDKLSHSIAAFEGQFPKTR